MMIKHKESQDFQKQGFWKKRSLGQNFLINPHIVDKLVDTANINKNDTIIEVGPGTGNLTKKLAEKAKQIITIEKDKRLIPVLEKEFQHIPNVRVVEGDALERGLPEALLLEGEGYKIVANIPYYITSIFLRAVFEKWSRSKLIVLMIQKEVAQRIMAKPPHMNLLALSIQYYSEPEIISYISRNNFRPVPKVDSAIIKLKPKVFPEFPEARLLETQENGRLFKLIRAGFSEKRKQLAPILSKKLKIGKEKILESFDQAEILTTARAENLSLKQWELLEQSLNTQIN